MENFSNFKERKILFQLKELENNSKKEIFLENYFYLPENYFILGIIFFINL